VRHSLLSTESGGVREQVTAFGHVVYEFSTECSRLDCREEALSGYDYVLEKWLQKYDTHVSA
jgi:hypothetical protein